MGLELVNTLFDLFLTLLLSNLQTLASLLIELQLDPLYLILTFLYLLLILLDAPLVFFICIPKLLNFSFEFTLSELELIDHVHFTLHGCS